MDLAFEDYERMVDRLAWSFVYTTGLEYEELVGVAREAFFEKIPRWDPSCGTSPSTFVYTVVRNRLRDFVRHRQLCPSFDGEFDEELIPSPYQELVPGNSFRDCLQELSEEAQLVCNIILTEPVDILGLTGTESPREIRGILWQHLRDTGWSQRTVWGAFTEIKDWLGTKRTL